jgi:hypothetical protein
MKNFAPRAGFAYGLTDDGKTSLRGGAGSFYDTQTPGVINNRFADLTPFSPQIAVTSPAGPFSNPALGIANYPFPFTYPPAKNSLFPAPVLAITHDPTTNFEVPVSYNWNLTLERQVAQDWLSIRRLSKWRRQCRYRLGFCIGDALVLPQWPVARSGAERVSTIRSA